METLHDGMTCLCLALEAAIEKARIKEFDGIFPAFFFFLARRIGLESNGDTTLIYGGRKIVLHIMIDGSLRRCTHVINWFADICLCGTYLVPGR